MRAVALVALAVAAARPAIAQMCPDGTPPPCRAAPRRAAPPAPGSKLRPYTIIAEFDGTAPADVRAAAKNLVISALEESGVLAALPEEQIRLGLALAGRDTTARVDLATARELAVRGSVRTVVTGTIDQVGQTYHAAVRVLDADSNRVVAARRDIARGEDDLIPTLDRVVRAVRADLGERRAAIAANRSLNQAATPSLAAFKRFQRAKELVMDLDNFGAREAYKEALALDSGFASAWLGLRAVYNNLGFHDSAGSALKEALARPDRLTEQQRVYSVEIPRACSVGDAMACLAAREQAQQRYGGSPMGFSMYLHGLGRDSEAAALVGEWERRAPFGLRPIERFNLMDYLLPIGRFDEARRVAASLFGENGTLQRMHLAAWTADWPAADSLARSFLEQSRNQRFRREAVKVQAAVAAARGRVREAVGLLQTCGCWYAQLVLRMVADSAVTGAQLGTLAPDTSAEGQLFAAEWAVAAGDTGTARRILTRVRGLPPERRRGLDADATLAEGLLAAAAGRPSEVVRLLRPLSDGRASGAPDLTQPAQWLLAAAYERQGHLDSSAAQLERLASWQGARPAGWRGLTHSFAHQRLVLLYARLGRLEDARRHWKIFSETFTSPDPELQHLVDEARAALASAERGR